ncbi:MAG: hypothetical protein U1F18_01910 [Steroidobacteraceae bacterium]
MVTKLERPVRREVRIGQKPYVVTIMPDRLRLAIKGRRKGQEIPWEDLVGEQDDAPGAAPEAATRTPLPRVGTTGVPGAR